jgi:hypothetical protein
MTRTTATLVATLCGICGFGALPASAADVRGELTPDLIYDHCVAAGIGSETEDNFMLADGRRVTGSVLCTADDLVAAKAKPSGRHDDDGNDDDEGDDEDEGYDA